MNSRLVIIVVETGTKTSTEYVFVDTLCKWIGLKKADYKIVMADGVNNLAKSTAVMQEMERATQAPEKAKVIILFDADDDIARRRRNIKGSMKKIEQKKGLNIDYDIFLFPNNQDPGCFEHLLEKITAEKHQKLLRCFGRYEDCIGDKYRRPDIKAKMYAYMSVQIPSRTEWDKMNKKGDWDFRNEEYWNLDASYLQGLKEVLKSA